MDFEIFNVVLALLLAGVIVLVLRKFVSLAIKIILFLVIFVFVLQLLSLI